MINISFCWRADTVCIFMVYSNIKYKEEYPTRNRRKLQKLQKANKRKHVVHSVVPFNYFLCFQGDGSHNKEIKIIMKSNRSQFLKTLELYGKISNVRKHIFNKSMGKAIEFKSISLSAFYLLYIIYLIGNPIRHFVTLMQLQNSNTTEIFVYFYVLLYRCFLSLFCLIKVFRDSNDTKLIQYLTHLQTVGDDKKSYSTNLIYSSTTVYVYIFGPVISYICIDSILPHYSNDFLAFLTFPVPTNNTYYIPVLTIQNIFNSLSLTIVLLDLYVGFITTITLIYEFNKVTKEAQTLAEEHQSDKFISLKKHRNITEICNSHDTLSKVLRLVNETLQITTGFIMISSIISCCIVIYGMINNSWKTDQYTYIYVLLMTSVTIVYLIKTIWSGVRLNRQVSVIRYLYDYICHLCIFIRAHTGTHSYKHTLTFTHIHRRVLSSAVVCLAVLSECGIPLKYMFSGHHLDIITISIVIERHLRWLYISQSENHPYST